MSKKPTLDDLISLKQLARHRDVHYMTAYRWSTRGIKVDGCVVKLRTLRRSNQRLTTLRWLNEFEAQQQDDQRSRDAILKPNRASVAKQLEEELAT